MTDPSQLEAVVRGVAIGGFAAAGLALVATPRPTPTRWLGAVFFICAIAHVICGWRPTLERFDPIWAASVVGTGLFWMFALDLLEDAPHPPVWRLVAPIGALLFWLAAQVAPLAWCPAIWSVYLALQILLVGHLLLVAWRGWRGDLVPQRRRLRPMLAAAAGGYVLVVAAKDMGWLPFLPTGTMGVVQAGTLAILALGTTLALLRAEPQLVEAQPDSLATPVPAPASMELGPADRLVLARLDKAMSQDEVWRGEELSIGALAALVGAPEHRLRRLINGVLGHRNFADYVNSRRIGAAREALADPNLALKSISTIAYELGFGSLGPFNRAFRTATGSTPTAWRQEACGPVSPHHLRLVGSADLAPESNRTA